MSKPLQFYTQQKEFFETELAEINSKLMRSSIIRLVLVCAVLFGVYYFFSNTQVVIPIIVVGIIIFIFLVSKHSDLALKRDKLKTLLAINQTEIDVLNGDISALGSGLEFQDQLHAFSYDIDLFGKGSFFQNVNRTTIASGKRLLAWMLTSNEIEGIPQKQEAIQELSEKPKWRQNFSATASLVQVETSASQIIQWLKQHKSFVPRVMKYLPLVFMALSLGIFVLNYFAILPLSVTTLWFFIGLGITGVYVKRINQLYQNASKAKDTFKQYYQLLALIEAETFTSEALQKKQQEIKTEHKKASEIFLEFSKILDAFDQRNNMMVGVFSNAFALRDLQLCYKIEQWIATYQDQIEHWFEVLAFFDAQNSLANYAFNHPTYVFPVISETENTVKAINLGHPLLTEAKRIDNNFTIQQQQFFIITGANMAGKSTFLRTVSLSIVMANVGMPVCAEAFEYNPIKLITSMRTSDSLTDDESYFFSELKRLKFIVDEIDPDGKGDRYFIILDEILKGTNSTDKAIGSRKFVERLVRSNATGIIATHDLSLCEISEELPEVKNYYFDAEIINNELHFDYTFKQGVCKNMNASFLLQKMEII
ncbi:MutS-related protein [Ulvibacter litoralis]|uniref:MutS domain V n=1 Tax=Ulvibacter litoralis TaxID=227084 RepID=A0A1G7CIW1_9FLAO|nr:DNA mismatch repair protein MutS [Ulvibacter litoralis]GHC47218.1 hypothetical protein GCM10008083_07970 [Ulvibacter litoralis]SDE39181.1 MutS domain V [Ulvibacter litoralis]